MYVINSRGEQEPFSAQKVERSARKVGASLKLAKEIAREVQQQAYQGIATQEIFQKVKSFLEVHNPSFGIKFSLKQAMRALGPTGFHFEKYIAAILREMGYKVLLNQFISGKCLKKYEIDFLACKAKLFRFGECKYHSQVGMAVPQDVALANYARFLDIKQGNFSTQKTSQGFSLKSILVTNARFSERAIKYSQCVGVELWGWKYPANNGLEAVIDKERLYPITILPSFQKHWAEIFSQKNLMLAKDFLGIDLNKFASENSIPQKELQLLLRDAKILLANEL